MTTETTKAMQSMEMKQSLPYQPFIEANNHGVCLLLSDQYDDAITFFTSALNHVNANRGRGAVQHSNDLSTMHERAAYFVIQERKALTVPVDAGKELFVFTNPILVSQEINRMDYNFSSKLSIAAMFNLALSYHLCAIQKQSLELIEKALSYYQLAYKILIDETHVVVSQAMAILNNIGQIHRLLRNDAGAKDCFEYLLSTMLFVLQIGEADRIQNWESFLSNVMDFIVDTPNPAAAA
jgi:tetratricopeptide (TPR) repeat protein